MHTRWHRGWWFLLVVTGPLVLSNAACAPLESSPVSRKAEKAKDEDANRAKLPAATRQAALYLARLCDDEGQFTYRLLVDDEDYAATQYNVVRHAGAVYALAQYCLACRGTPEPEVRNAMLRAAKFLRQHCLAPVANNRNLLAAWSDPELTGAMTLRRNWVEPRWLW